MGYFALSVQWVRSSQFLGFKENVLRSIVFSSSPAPIFAYDLSSST